MKKKFVVIGLAVVLPLVVTAQYEIEWFKIGSGGGRSVGGEYEIKGTIGQQDVGRSASGDYELVAGFWVFALVIQSEGGPQLHIRYLSPKQALIYWDGDAPLAILQRSTDLADEAGWADDTGTPILEEGEYRLIVTPSAVPYFYRLRVNE